MKITGHEVNLGAIARFFLKSLHKISFWRNRRIRKYLRSTREPKLQIGCGPNLLEGWLNSGISLQECRTGVYLDAGRRFPFPDCTFDFVFSEHLFEHLTYPQATNMLKECYRVLKPGGVMRVATPDLRFLLGLYQEPEKSLHKRYIEYSAERGNIPPTAVFVINRFHTAWGHQIVYDKATLSDLLEQNGFKNIRSCEVSQSEHPALNGVEGHFKSLPAEYNQLETMVLEASK
jgi:predicted SAM-dependent methyltransferase